MSGLRILLARRITALLCLALGCSRATQTAAVDAPTTASSADMPIVLPVQVHADSGSLARARADSMQRPYTQADIDFFTGMISHHSQAIIMSRWAPTHGASAEVQR